MDETINLSAKWVELPKNDYHEVEHKLMIGRIDACCITVFTDEPDALVLLSWGGACSCESDDFSSRFDTLQQAKDFVIERLTDK